MLSALKSYPNTVKLLLSASFILTLARAIALPYLVIYLSGNFSLSISETGVVVGSSLIVGSLLSLYGGYLVDKVSSYPLILICSALFILGFLGTYLAHQLWLFYLCLVLIYLAYAVVDIAVKAGFASLLPVEKRSEAFSIKYTLTNIGFAVGPFLGAAVAPISIGLPFLISAGLGSVFFLLYWRYGDKRLVARELAAPPVSFAAVGKLMLKDYRLVCFTVGGLLSAVAFGQFSAFLSQYLVTTTTPEFTYKIISAVLATNATMVICLQYLIGKRISSRHLNLWLAGGLSMFVLGLAGFAFSTSVLFWVLAMIVFTLGEIIVFPAEYMFIDQIAPEHLRGMYYGAQNLANLGAALGPVLCGLVLSSHPGPLMFVMLIGFVVAGGVFYCLGAANLNTVTQKKVA